MKATLLLSLSLFLGTFAFAQDDSTSTPNSRIAPAPVEPAATEAQTSEDQYSVNTRGDLRPRTHNLNWSLSSSRLDLDGAERRSAQVSATYGYNFGHFQPFVGLNSSATETDTTEIGFGVFTIGLRVNIIRNEPGNDWIPYVSLSRSGYAEKWETDVDEIEIEGALTSLAFGLAWYPFGEIFAVDFGYGITTGELESDSNLEADYELVGFNVGFILSF